MYDVNTNQSIKALVGHIGTVTGLAPAVTGKLLFSASYDTTVQVQTRDDISFLGHLSIGIRFRDHLQTSKLTLNNFKCRKMTPKFPFEC